MSLALYETEVGATAAARLQAVLPCLQVLLLPQSPYPSKLEFVKHKRRFVLSTGFQGLPRCLQCVSLHCATQLYACGSCHPVASGCEGCRLACWRPSTWDVPMSACCVETGEQSMLASRASMHCAHAAVRRADIRQLY